MVDELQHTHARTTWAHQRHGENALGLVAKRRVEPPIDPERRPCLKAVRVLDVHSLARHGDETGEALARNRQFMADQAARNLRDIQTVVLGGDERQMPVFQHIQCAGLGVAQPTGLAGELASGSATSL